MVAYVIRMIDVLGKGILYLVVKFSPEVNTSLGCILSKLLWVISFGGICLGVLVSGFSLGSYSHDAEWSLFQGRPLVAVLSTAFFTIRLTDLAELLVKVHSICYINYNELLRVPGLTSLGEHITLPKECQVEF